LINKATKGARTFQYTKLDVTQVIPFLADNNFSSLSECDIEAYKSKMDRIKVKDGETDRETQFLTNLQMQGVQINTISKFLIMGQKRVGKKLIIVKHFLVFNNAKKPDGYSDDPSVSNTIVCHSLSSLTKMKKEFDAIRDALLRHQVRTIYLLIFYHLFNVCLKKCLFCSENSSHTYTTGFLLYMILL